MKRLIPILLACAVLSGCELRPLYGGGTHGAAAQGLGQVEIAPIPGKAGWLVRNALSDRLGAMPQGTPRYRLEIELDDRISGFGVRADDSVTRERRTLRARYRLIENAQGSVVLDATAGSDAGIDIVSSDYAAIAAENTALENLSQVIADQIVTRLAVFARNTGSAAPSPAP